MIPYILFYNYSLFFLNIEIILGIKIVCDFFFFGYLLYFSKHAFT